MQEVHPAACEQCCKLIAEQQRKLPEALSESLYACGQAIILIAGFLSSIFAGAALFILAVTGHQHWTNSSQKVKARARAIRESINKRARCKGIEHLYLRQDSLNRHIVYQQHAKMQAAEYKLIWGSDDETLSAADALESLQKEHDDYVNEMHVYSQRYAIDTGQK